MTTKPLEASQTLTKLDLTVGNPAYMQEYWDLVDKCYSGSMGTKKTHSQDLMSYDYEQVNAKLKDEVKWLHNKVGNAETRGYEVVFGNGAAQLVSAAMYAVTKMGATEGIVHAPYWGRIKQLMKMGASAAYNFTSVVTENGEYPTLYSDTEIPAELIIWPNNPDNSLIIKKCETASKFKIHDLCYNWPQYISEKSRIKRADDIMIFGLAKATGHAGTRFGWALVKNKETYQHMKKYIELSTSGVSTDAQSRALTIISTIKKLYSSEFTSCFDFGKAELDSRWKQFTKAAEKHKESFEILNSDGMFAWCEWQGRVDGAQKMLDAFSVLVIGGDSFGWENSHFRLNMGCSKESFHAMLERMSV